MHFPGDSGDFITHSYVHSQAMTQADVVFYVCASGILPESTLRKTRLGRKLPTRKICVRHKGGDLPIVKKIGQRIENVLAIRSVRQLYVIPVANEIVPSLMACRPF